MFLEKPKLYRDGDLKSRLEAMERYLYRLVWELETILETLEGGEKNGKDL